jgi:hypothetical protein
MGASMWWEGRVGRAIGGASFLLLVFSEFDYASNAGLLDLARPATERWRVLLFLLGFVTGLSIKPPVSFMAVYGSYLWSGMVSFIFFLFAALFHWANTGEIIDNARWFQFCFIIALPPITAYWLWRLPGEWGSRNTTSIAKLTTSHPLATILYGILTFSASIVIARARLGVSWEAFFGVLPGP